MSENVYINGKYLTASRVKVAPDGTGFLYGDGLFETFKSINGKITGFGQHISRLLSSMRELRYKASFEPEALKSATLELIEKNGLSGKDAMIKIIAVRGSYAQRLRFDHNSEPIIMITAKKYIPYPEKSYKSGFKIISASVKRNSMQNIAYRHKLLNYFENIYCRNEAYQASADDAFFTTTDRLVLECTASNIFIVKSGKVYTPPLTQNILPGITRNIVIKVCRENKIPLYERKIHYYDLLESGEVFLTNSLMGIMPVSAIDTHDIKGHIFPGFTTGMLSVFYDEIKH